MSAKFVAEIHPVREVSIRGAADLRFWRDRLRAEGLEPEERDGRAQLLICGAAMKFKGISFAEMSVSVKVAGPNSVFLIFAFNSSRLFSFSERVFFSTPYRYAKVELETAPRPSLRVVDRGQRVFQAGMGSDRKPTARGDEDWEGTIHLPGTQGKYFHARLAGPASVYPFLSEADSLAVDPSHPLLEGLDSSRFQGLEWLIRESGTHARSKTLAGEGRRVM